MTTATTIDAADRTSAAEDRTSERAFLIVYLEEGIADGRARMIDLPDGTEVTFGRSRTSTISIDHDRVSRVHARVLRSGAQITVEDLGSRNGTRVNGLRISGPTEVHAGDELGVGPALAVIGWSSGLARRTAIGSTSHLDERLAAECDRASRYRRPFGLLMVRLEGDDDATAAALDRIADEVRRMDVVAEYGPDEYAVLIPECERDAVDATARRLASAGRAAASAGLTAVHIGIACSPDDGVAADQVLGAARAALRAARLQDRRGGIAAAPREEPLIAGGMILADPAMRRLHELIGRIAPTPMTVLVLGETGAGKELVAAALHERSGRREGPLVKLNCASLPETLLASELFGHERGAFTGADRRKIGFFEAASGGTLFLDELGELPIGLQAQLLRVLERRVITRLGSTAEIAVDVRIVAATNRDLEKEIARGGFREDLYFRVSAFTLVVPPLRDRRGEIGLLATHFANGFARELGLSGLTLSTTAQAALERYDWPGNVRELRNAIERAAVLQSDGTIELDHLPTRVRDGASTAATATRSAVLFPAAEAGDVREQIAEVERAAIVAALEVHGGNQTRAALGLGISRRALIYKMEKHGLKDAPVRRT